jgi:hypothetical protein
MEIRKLPRYFESTVPWGNGRLNFKIRIDVDRAFNAKVLNGLRAWAVSRGVFRLNILDSIGKLKFTRVTCRSMTIPIEVLDHVLKEKLPFEKTLEQPDFIGLDERFNAKGDGIIIALRGAAILPGAQFFTKADSPIILRENSTASDRAKIMAGTVVGPGETV